MEKDKNFFRRDHEQFMNRNAASLRGNIDRYYEWNLSVFPIEKNKQILDIGCGPGIYFDAIMQYSPTRYVGVDYSQSYLDELERIMAGRSNCETIRCDLLDPAAPGQFNGYRFDYILCLDVLEHLEDDVEALRNVLQLMCRTGARQLFLRVPALQGIYGHNDRAIGHYRRYSKPSLETLLSKSYFRINLIQYHNLPGIIPWYFFGRILKRSLAASAGESRVFNIAVPVIRFFEGFIPPPMGLSLYCVCSPQE